MANDQEEAEGVFDQEDDREYEGNSFHIFDNNDKAMIAAEIH